MSRKDEVYNFILKYKQEHNGNSPTYSQILKVLGISYNNSIYLILRNLENEGLIERDEKRRISIPNSEWSMKE